jgi:regulatory protein
LLDDDRFLENFLLYHAGRGQGPLRVRAQLRRHGLDGARVEASLGAYPDWLAQLHKARQKKFGAQPPNNYADRQRQARFLTYRGFTSAQIRTALGVDVELNADGEES